MENQVMKKNNRKGEVVFISLFRYAPQRNEHDFLPP